ncbi:putative peptidoglycan binding protein [Litoreibacter halocynthiae]|uniref:Putative peptidoglycan binding protein n=1 Tax=Litoreibacter halocynthiae TaxID=1242689 RepID=A0A4V3EW70_9RHOB|nr:peptidoglycan-binding protein [Litoreibacter halocynthiae]TDT72975.1 putative peptidoglycan binding protein [Litoreibacter halocynthiae]
MKLRASLAAFLMMSVPVWAGDVALVVGNEDYANGRDLNAADEMLDAVAPLEEAGFEVLSGSDLTSEALAGLVSELNAKVDGTGRVVIALAGHFGNSLSGNWFIGADADVPDLGAVAAQSASLNVLMDIAARAPGGAVVALGLEDAEFEFGAGVQPGLDGLDVPQGVSVITGPSGDVADFAKDALGVKGQSIANALNAWPSLTGSGFVAPLVPFLPSDGVAPPVVAKADPDAEQKAFWKVTQDIGTMDAFEAYLKRHPDGLFAADARAEVDKIKAQPLLLAEQGEKALNLSRDRRREIQRALSLLEYDPKGIDGIFGRGSRAAIRKWQNVNGETATGFVTQSQIERLGAQADRRAQELEIEAEKRKIELERKDRAYWRATGQGGDETGLRAYLERYPDGVFAEIATARLEPFEEARRAAAAEQDRAAWDAAESVGSLAAYEGYVQANPEGAFVEQARAKIAELEFEAKNAGALEAAQRNEERLGLNGTTRRLVEDRLESLGLKPGAVDGVFDDDSRRAIRRYQEARNLPRTGFLNQQTLVRLLADSVLR